MKSNSNRHTPKYVRIAQTLCDDIAAHYQPGDYLPSERALQKTYQVTANTIRQALSVLARKGIIATLPYRGTVVLQKPAEQASSLLLLEQTEGSSGKAVVIDRSGDAKKTVALVMPMATYLVALLVGGAERELRRHGYRLQLCATHVAMEHNNETAQLYERHILASLAQDGVAGVIWWSIFGDQNKEAATALLSQGIPVVLVDSPVPSLACDWVGIDDYGAAVHATEHLLRLGHKHIVFWGLELRPTIPTAIVERWAGFLDAVSRANEPLFTETPLHPLSQPITSRNQLAALLPKEMLDISYFDEEPSLEILLSRSPRPTAALVATDHAAHKFITQLEARGLRVPQDIAIVSFGDIDRFSNPPPRLTSVRQPFEEMGRRAVRLIQQRLQEPDRPFQHIHLPTQLIVRQSCGGAQATQAGGVERDATGNKVTLVKPI